MVLVVGMTATIEPTINMGTCRVFIVAEDAYSSEALSVDEKASEQADQPALATQPLVLL